MTNTYKIEYTDTFGGEANYTWVKRATVDVADKTARRELMKAAKACVGLTGVRGTVQDCGDMIEFRPYGSCTVMFVTYRD